MEPKYVKQERRMIKKFHKRKVTDVDISIKSVGNRWQGASLGVYRPNFFVEVSEVQRAIGNPSRRVYKLIGDVRGCENPFFSELGARQTEEKFRNYLIDEEIEAKITRDDTERERPCYYEQLNCLQKFRQSFYRLF